MLYFIVTTLTTVGYGDITPINYDEILFIVIIIVFFNKFKTFGIGMFGYYLGNIVSVIENFIKNI